MTEYRGLLFDLDGTLVDSVADICAAVNHMLLLIGLPSLREDAVRRMIGDGLPKLAERALEAAGGDMSTLAEFTMGVSSYYQEHAADHTACFPNVFATLQYLYERGIRLGVVTNKPVSATRIILRSLELSDFIDVVVGGDSLPVRKPDPAPVIEAVRLLGISPEHILMVGDSAHDVDAAFGAGIKSVAVTYGYHRSPPSSFNADHLIDSFEDLLAIVLQIAPIVPFDKAYTKL
ncbi:MAG: phosphoglycolate phosphatase [Bradyrhizobiaceae bacterium]|nr:MAG: phosphoglycolate phosphatase [Bradyrhizobiaceae bacterium]